MRKRKMITAALSRATVVCLALFAMACGRSTPTGPTSQVPIVPSTPAPAPTNFPPQSGPSRTFTFDHELNYGVSDYTKHSRFVLYDDGAFALQYPSLSAEYRGAYTESNGNINFQWEGWSLAGPWGATGTVADGSLTVKYNLIMDLSGFENAVYGLAESHITRASTTTVGLTIDDHGRTK